MWCSGGRAPAVDPTASRRPWAPPDRSDLRRRLDAVRPLAIAGAAAGILGAGAFRAAQGLLGAPVTVLAAVAAGTGWYVAVSRLEPEDAALVVVLTLPAMAGGSPAVAVSDAWAAGALYFSGAQGLSWARAVRRAKAERESLPLVVNRRAV